MQNFHPGHPVTRQKYLMQRCRRQLQQRHLMSEVKWVEPALIPIVNAVSAIKGSPQKKKKKQKYVGWHCERVEDKHGGWGERLRSFYGHFVRWKFENGCAAGVRCGAYWNIALSFAMPGMVWYDMMVARYGRLIADAKQQPQLTDECAKSTGKIWKFTRCSQYKKEFVFFFRWHPVEAHRFICIMGWCVCGCALDYSAVFSLCCLLPLPSLPHTKQSKYARS